MARHHRSHSVAFKRQVAEEFLAGEPLHGLAKRHDVCRHLSRVWVAKYAAGAFDEDARATDLMQAYEAGSPRSSDWSASRPSGSSS
jgi:transposase